MAHNNHTEDLTGVVGVDSILKHYNATIVIKVTVGMLGWEDTTIKQWKK